MSGPMFVLVVASKHREELEMLARERGFIDWNVFEIKEALGIKKDGHLGSRDELYRSAVELVTQRGSGSVSLLQRVLQIGYSRAARLIDAMEHEGIVGAWAGKGQPRKTGVRDTETVPATEGP